LNNYNGNRLNFNGNYHDDNLNGYASGMALATKILIIKWLKEIMKLIKKLKIGLDGKHIIVKNVFLEDKLGKFIGLMFSEREKAPILLFEMKKPASIHSFFVFFPFIALWLDDKNHVVKWKIVRPFTFYVSCKGKFSKIIEVPISRRHYDIVKLIVGERFKN